MQSERAAAKADWWLTVRAAKLADWPPRSAETHCLACISALLYSRHLPHLLPLAPCRCGRCPEPTDQRQDVGEQPAGHRDLSELERDVSAVLLSNCLSMNSSR